MVDEIVWYGGLDLVINCDPLKGPTHFLHTF